MKRILFGFALFAWFSLNSANDSFADITYLDATSGASGNTTLANGSPFNPPLNGTTGADNNWEQRTTFGSGGNVFESSGEAAGANENAPELRTRITGLTAGHQYQVFVYFWDPTSTAEDWNVRAGVSSNPGANSLFSAADATGELSSTAGVLASGQTFATGFAPTIFAEGGRALWAANLGIVTASLSGTIDLFIDDLGNAGTVNRRTWFDGVGYQFSAVPEPSSLALLSFLAVGCLARRKTQRRKSLGQNTFGSPATLARSTD